MRNEIRSGIFWAFPLSVITAAALLPFRADAFIPAVAIVWGLALAVYLSFPLYERWLRRTKRRSVAGITLDVGQPALVLALWLMLMLFWTAVDLARGTFSLDVVAPWGLGLLLLLAILGLDLTGSTPRYKSGLQADRLLRISLDAGACKGAAFCEQVCPKDVFEIDHERRQARIARPEDCVQCGACIVQCPFDALYFESPSGEIVPPEVVREFKLNLLGTRDRAKRG